MATLKVFNQIKDMYKGGLITLNDGQLQCPVCKKKYKREKSAETHISQKSCYKLKDVVAGTTFENAALELFVAIKTDKKVPIHVFRKSGIYNSTVRFVLFCAENEVKAVGDYYAWFRDYKAHPNANENMILSNAIKSLENVKEFRLFQQKNPELIDDDFFQIHYDELVEDDNFLTRSIEKSHISLSRVIEDSKLLDNIMHLPMDYFDRIEKIYEEI